MPDSTSRQAHPAAPLDEQRLETAGLVRVLAMVGVFLLVVGVVVWNIHTRVPGSGFAWNMVGEVGRMLYLGREANVTTWYSAMLLAGVALGLVLNGLARRGADLPWRSYIGLAAIALFMSADEASSIHERLGPAAARLGLALPWTFGWLILGVPLALLAIGIIVWLARGIDPTLRRRLIVAGFVFLLGAIGFEMLGGAINSHFGGVSQPLPALLYQSAQFIEEALEVAGALIALWATLEALDLRLGPRGLVVAVREPAEARRA